MLELTQIFIYPIKGLGGISLSVSKVECRGLQWDRRWLLVDDEGKFLTQRSLPQMTLLQPDLKEQHLVVQHKNEPQRSISIPLELPTNLEKRQVVIWRDTCEAVVLGAKYDQWFSKILGIKCHLVFMPDSTKRAVNPEYAQTGDIVSFADGYPILIAGEASLEDLNSRLKDPVPMNRFRANLIFSSGKPYEEDTWKVFQIGKNLVFRGIKPHSRCQVITIDQNTGIFNKEPLRTLSQYRKQGKEIVFGVAVCWDVDLSDLGNIELKVGDKIEVLQ